MIIELSTGKCFKSRLSNLRLCIQFFLSFLNIFLLQYYTLKLFSLIHRYFLKRYTGRITLVWHSCLQFELLNMLSFFCNVFLPVPIEVVKLIHINDRRLLIKWWEISLGSIVICHCHHWLQAYKSCLLFTISRFGWLRQTQSRQGQICLIE
jgi:hypothetical protein